MAALGIAFKGAESAWKMYKKYKKQIDEKIREMQKQQTASTSDDGTNVASSGVNYDLYNYLDKRYGIEASNWYENNPTLPHESNPFIPTPEAPYVPLASNPNNPVSGTDDKTEIALPPAAILAAMAALGIAIKGAETTWKLYRKYKQQIDQKVKEMQDEQGQTA